MINKKIVMILEDDIDLAEGIELSLKDEKLNFIICNTIAEARKALTLYSFDLLIFDINLPDGKCLWRILQRIVCFQIFSGKL